MFDYFRGGTLPPQAMIVLCQCPEKTVAMDSALL
jgi:hypothetical protein